jgi:carboxypeptidase T
MRFDFFTKNQIATSIACGLILTSPLALSANNSKVAVAKSEQTVQGVLIASKISVADKSLARKIAISYHHAILETNYQQGYIIADLTSQEITKLKTLNLNIETATEWNKRYKSFQNQVATQFEQRLEGVPDNQIQAISGFECYATVEETLDDGATLATDNPTLAEWIDIGDSWEKENNQAGYDLMVLKITNQNIVEDKPKLFIHSSMHAREYTPAALTLDFAKQLLNDYQTDIDTQWIVDYHEIHILFHMNPDGRKIAETGIFQRKNTNANHCPGLNVGVDLNRNFAYFWGTTIGGSSGEDCDSTFRGSEAESEPETQAVSNYIRSLYPDVRGDNITDGAPDDTPGMHIDIHSYSELVLWPWGHTTAISPNDSGFVALGNKFAWFNDYTPQQSVGLYPTDGTSDDVSYGELGIAAFTFELGTSFFQQCTDYNDTIKPDNLSALKYAAKASAAPYLLAHGPEVTSISLNGSLNGVTVGAGTSINLIATADATRSQLSTTGKTISKIEYSIDTPIWKATAALVDVTGNDGSLSSGVESFDSIIDTSGLSSGKHIVYLRSYDESDNQGVTSAALITISDDNNQSPTASFTTSCTELTCDYDANTSSDSDGSIDSYSWDFGDSNSATGVNPSHTYAVDGTYTVSLTVTDNNSATSTSSEQITVTSTNSGGETTGGFTETDVSPSQGQSLSYTIDVPANSTSLVIDISGGTGNADLAVNFGSAPTRNNFECLETGTGNVHNCTVANPSEGNWFIIVRGAQASSGVQLDAYWFAETAGNSDPTSNFNTSTNLLNVILTDTSSDSDGSITNWDWDFGDGNTSNLQNPNHDYSVAGTYTISLTVTDNEDATNVSSQNVTVAEAIENQLPTSTFSFTSNNLVATFIDTSSDTDGTIDSWSWDFNDGNTSTSQLPIHTYASAGTYNVTLTVTDDQGATNTNTESVTVSQATTPTSGGFTETGISPARNENFSYTIDVPAGTDSLEIDTSGGTGDVDLVVNFGSTPTRNDNDCIDQGAGNTHNCTITNPTEGTWFIIMRGRSTSTDAQLDAYWFDN